MCYNICFIVTSFNNMTDLDMKVHNMNYKVTLLNCIKLYFWPHQKKSNFKLELVKNVIFTCNTCYTLFISNSLKILWPECLATVVKIKSEGIKIKNKKNFEVCHLFSLYKVPSKELNKSSDVTHLTWNGPNASQKQIKGFMKRKGTDK